MKNILLLVMLLFVASSVGFASNKVEIDKALTETSQIKSISINLGDITQLNETELLQLITESISNKLPGLPVLQCSVSVVAEINIGVTKISVTVTVSGDCAEVRAAGIEIANQVIAALKAQLMHDLQ